MWCTRIHTEQEREDNRHISQIFDLILGLRLRLQIPMFLAQGY